MFTETVLGLFIASGLVFQFYTIGGKKCNGFQVAPVIMNERSSAGVERPTGGRVTALPWRASP